MDSTLPPRSARSRKSPKKKVQIADETARALDMAREGKSLREIAAELGCSHAKVHYLIENGRKEIPKESLAAYTAKIVEQCEGIIAAHWNTRTDPDSSKVILSAHRNLMALQGLEAPKQVLQVTQDVTGSTPAEAQRIMRELFANGVGPPMDEDTTERPPTEH